MLNLISAAHATNTAVNAAPSPMADFKSSSLMSFLPIGIVFAIFYFLMIRPQQKKMREHKTMVDAIKVGDSVLTAGGITGIVAKIVSASDIKVTIAPGVDVVVVRSSLSQVFAKESVTPKHNASHQISSTITEPADNIDLNTTQSDTLHKSDTSSFTLQKKLTPIAKPRKKTPVLMPSQMRAKKTLNKTK